MDGHRASFLISEPCLCTASRSCLQKLKHRQRDQETSGAASIRYRQFSGFGKEKWSTHGEQPLLSIDMIEKDSCQPDVEPFKDANEILVSRHALMVASISFSNLRLCYQ